MLIWEKEIPSNLVQRYSIVRTTIFTGLFALAFINIYDPFEVKEWYPTNSIQLFFYSSLVILAGMLVIVLSRIIMVQVSKRFTLNYFQYGVWVFTEIVSMSAVYSLFAIYALEDTRLFSEIIKISVKNTTLVLLLPYTVLWLYFAYREKTKQLEAYSQAGINKLNTDKMIPFYDEKGKLKFSVISDDLLFIEASDNYVSIYYDSNNKMSKYMVRTTLKNLEDKLKGQGFIRCHRSFLVNFNKVKLLKREKDGLYLELNIDSQHTLPVSKTYVTSIIESFSELSR